MIYHQMIHDAVERQPPLVPDTTNGSGFGLGQHQAQLLAVRVLHLGLSSMAPDSVNDDSDFNVYTVEEYEDTLIKLQTIMPVFFPLIPISPIPIQHPPLVSITTPNPSLFFFWVFECCCFQ